MLGTANSESCKERDVVIHFDEKAIDEVFSSLDRCHHPGAAVGITLNGVPVYRKGFGLASAEQPMVLTSSTRMRIGSASKHFTCLAYLLLCEQGRAGLHDPLGFHLPELAAATRGVTIRQLMGHVSGLRDACNLKFHFSGIGGAPVTSEALVSLYEQILEVDASPGTTWAYSNGAYVLLTAAIERISGRPLEDVLRTSIFEPSGLYDTMVRRWDTDFVADSASSHVPTAFGYERLYWGLDFAGGGAVVSTVNDMLRWLAQMDCPLVGSAATWSLMRTPQKLESGVMTDYALGLWAHSSGSHTVFGHSGGWLGAGCQWLHVPDAKLGIVVLVNRQDASATLLANQVLQTCLPAVTHDVSSSKGSIVTGVFSSMATGRVVELLDSNGQQVARIDGYELPCEQQPDGALRPTASLRQLKIELRLDGRPPARLTYTDFGQVDELTLLDAPSQLNLTRPCGTYRWEALGLEARFFEARGQLQLMTRDRFGSALYDELTCLAEGIWLAKPRGITAPWFSLVASFKPDCVLLRSTGLGIRPVVLQYRGD